LLCCTPKWDGDFSVFAVGHVRIGTQCIHFFNQHHTKYHWNNHMIRRL
jgi:hypothetical protein